MKKAQNSQPEHLLPAELISLVHYVELDKAGWWEKAIQHLCLTAIWQSGKSLTPQAISEWLRTSFAVRLDTSRIEAQAHALCSVGTLTELPNGEFKITESELSQLQHSYAHAIELQAQVEARFANSLERHCPDLPANETWSQFAINLRQAIRVLGARTYELLSGQDLHPDKLPKLTEFVLNYPASVREPLREALVQFLNPRDDTVREYMLRSLNACFFLEAGNLDQQTLHALNVVVGSKPTFTLFLDTNFVFSVLGLHEHPANQAAGLLIELLEELHENVQVTLLVTQPTVDEARHVLLRSRDELRELRLTPNLASVALDFELRGLTHKFVEASAQAGKPISADDYFAPYLSDLVTILHGKHIELAATGLGDCGNNHVVRADVEDQLGFQERRQQPRPKSREQWLHDICLWYFVQSQRSPHVESPVDAKAWIITVDNKFIGYDAFKRKHSSQPVPVCLHPTVLIQILQFWIPRTPLLEQTIVGSLQLPLIVPEFSAETEKVTIRILETLSRYENVNDLPKEVVAGILVNQALRQKFTPGGKAETELELIREALLEEYLKANKARDLAQAENTQLQDQLAKSNTHATELEDKFRAQTERAGQYAEQLEREQNERRNLEAKVDDFATRLDQLEEGRRRKNERSSFIGRWVVLPLLSLLLFAAALAVGISSWLHIEYWPVLGALFFSGLIFDIWVVDWASQRRDFIRDWLPFIVVHKLKLFLSIIFGILASLLVNIVASAIWDWAKSEWNLK